MRLFSAILMSLSSVFSPQLLAEDWNQFRGPNGNGVSSAGSDLPIDWSEDSRNIRWRVKVPGRGWSSPVIHGRTVWLTTASGTGRSMSALAFDIETGQAQHAIQLFQPGRVSFASAMNTFASPTPVVEEGRLYAHFGRYGTACIDTKSGTKIWGRTDMQCRHFRGPGSSPIVSDELLFLTLDGMDRQYLTALDKATGETVWEVDRDVDYGTDSEDRRTAFSTPLLIEHLGRRQLISPTSHQTVAYDPETGDVLWRVRHRGINAAARPVYSNDLVYITAGAGATSLIAVHPDGEGDVTDTHIAWAYGSAVPDISSPLVVDDLLFLMNEDGVGTCLDAATGQRLWRVRHPGEFWASPLYGHGKVYLSNKRGQTFVIAAESEYERVAENTLLEGMCASPAVVERSLIVRTTSALYRIDPADTVRVIQARERRSPPRPIPVDMKPSTETRAAHKRVHRHRY